MKLKSAFFPAFACSWYACLEVPAYVASAEFGQREASNAIHAAHANRTTVSFGDDERACRDDSLCRLSYRDGGNILVGEAGRRRLRTLIGDLDTR